jgi:phosphoribosylanthranilate isomerase
MALSIAVMLRRCTHLSEARYAAGMEVQYLGFLFSAADTDDYRSQTKAIYDWVAGVELVAELTEANQALVNEVFATYQPSVWMVPAEVLPLLPTGAKVVLTGPDYGDTAKVIGYFREGDQATGMDFPVWLHYTAQLQLFEATERATVLVLDGRPEERPGFANLDHLADVLDALEVEG